MNTLNSKTYESNRFIYQFNDKLNLKNPSKNMALANSLCSYTRCVTHINDEHVETAEKFDIIMPMYNLIEYSDNYIDSSGSLHQFKRDESPMKNDGNTLNVALKQFIIF